jgi:transposase-like protein
MRRFCSGRRDKEATFRLFSTQLVINGNATQAEISRAFGVPLVTVKRYVKLYREAGAGAFFCACQEALSQQIDCGSLPRGPSIIGPGGGGAGSRSAIGDLG